MNKSRWNQGSQIHGKKSEDPRRFPKRRLKPTRTSHILFDWTMPQVRWSPPLFFWQERTSGQALDIRAQRHHRQPPGTWGHCGDCRAAGTRPPALEKLVHLVCSAQRWTTLHQRALCSSEMIWWTMVSCNVH